MLHLLRATRYTPTLRRLLTALLGVCMAVAFAEPLVADSCDGDAPAAVAGQYVAATDAPIGEAPRSAESRTEGDRRSGEHPPVHEAHLCHCTHAHASTPTRRVVMPVPSLRTALTTPRSVDRVLPSVTVEPRLRPPRATGHA